MANTSILFPDLPPRYEFERDAISFVAEAGNRTITCLVTTELLMHQFGASDPSEEALMTAYRENKEPIQDIARKHLEMGWLSPDNEVVLTTRYTRLQINYGNALRQWNPGLLLAQQACARLIELIGPAAGEVILEWDRAEGTQGRALVTLRISDSKRSVTAVFEPREMESSSRMQVRLARLWGDLLQLQFQKMMEQLLASHVEG